MHGDVGARDDVDPGLPLKLWPCSNGEYLPPPLDELRAEAMRRARAAADHHARRHGWSRRRFLLSSAGMASGLAALQACSDERSASESTEPGGRFTVPATAATDPEEATTTVHGDARRAGIVVDVQTHFLESGAWGTGFPQGACGEAEPIDCFSAEYWRDLVLAGSDTAVAVISAIPVVGEADPLSIDAMERGRALAAELCGDGHVLIQGHAVPDVGPLDAALAAMAEVAAAHELCAWKVYTHCPERVVPRRPRPVRAARRRAVPAGGARLRRARRRRAQGPLRRQRYASPVDIGPAAAANPDLAFLVYHSGYESGSRRAPYDPDGAGVDRLVRSVTEAGIGAARQRLRRARLDVAHRDGRSRPGRPRARQAARGVRSRAHPVGHGLDLVRLATGPDRRLPQLRDHRRLPGAVRLPGTDAGRQGAHPRDQRGRAVRHRAAGDLVPVGRGLRPAPTARSARSPAATSRRRSCASTRGSPPPSADPEGLLRGRPAANPPSAANTRMSGRGRTEPSSGTGDRYRDRRMFVKICGITNEDDALLAVAMGADAVGFVFAPSPRQIAVQQAYDITRRLPPEILTVGVFRDEHPKRVVDLVNRSGVKAAQLHGNENADVVAEVARSVKWVIKAYPAGSAKVAEAGTLATDLILLDAASPGSGQLFDWTLAGEVPEGVRLILAGGLDPGQRRRRREGGRAVGRRRVERRRAIAGQEGRPQGQAVHRAGQGRRARSRTSAPTSCPTTGATSDASSPAPDLMGEPTPQGRFGEFGGRFVPETLVPACQELEAAFREAWADDGVPRRARRRAARLRRPAVDPHRVPQPRWATGRAAAAQARGPQPHRLAQDQQRARPGAARQADGQDPARRRDRRRPARRRHGDGGGAVRHGAARSTWARSTSSARRSTCSACACSAPRSRPCTAAAAR